MSQTPGKSDSDAPRTPYTAQLGDRSLFPELEARAYLAHAAISPPSIAVREATRAPLDDFARRGAHAFATWFTQRARLRTTLAAMIGADARDIGLVPNTTQGVIDIALCFPWRRGDHVLTFEGEFPANVTPWQQAADLYGLEVRLASLSPFARSHDEGLAMLEQELRNGVRLVAVSHVEFQSGLRMPVERMAELCHRYGAELFVDAIQGCGAVPIDVRSAGIDYLSCGGHKWLMSLEGAGFLYIHPERVAALRPRVAGWLAHDDPMSFLWQGAGLLRYDRPIRAQADFVEPGAASTAGYAALEAAVDLIMGVGVSEVWAHAQRYLDALEDGLCERGFRSLRSAETEGRSAILGVIPPDPSGAPELATALNRRGVSCSVPDGVLRFAPHWPNAIAEVPDVLAAVDDALRS